MRGPPRVPRARRGRLGAHRCRRPAKGSAGLRRAGRLERAAATGRTRPALLPVTPPQAGYPGRREGDDWPIAVSLRGVVDHDCEIAFPEQDTHQGGVDWKTYLREAATERLDDGCLGCTRIDETIGERARRNRHEH